jgi:hypothetical protein
MELMLEYSMLLSGFRRKATETLTAYNASSLIEAKVLRLLCCRSNPDTPPTTPLEVIMAV